MDRALIEKTEAFLAQTFASSSWLRDHPESAEYRLQHSYRVANIAKAIAQAEGLDVTGAVIAGLLHDIAYCEEMADSQAWLGHGRRSAAIARPFLEGLGLPEQLLQEICYGIAVHADGKADFPGTSTPLAETVADADNIDRFDVYRIYETLEYRRFSALPYEQKREMAEKTLVNLEGLKNLELGTRTAKELWLRRLDFYGSFYERLLKQLDSSTAIL